MKKNINSPFFWILFLVVVSILTGCAAQVTSTPVVVTVVLTMPVEMTRVVEITRPVEVTREVVVTQIVQVPVTLTPAAPLPTQTIEPTVTTMLLVTPGTPQITPQEKGTGFTPVFIYNQTKNKIGLNISGPSDFSLTLWSGDVQKIWVLEGAYTYTVQINDQKGFSGSFKIVNPDKHQFFIYDTKAVLWGP